MPKLDGAASALNPVPPRPGSFVDNLAERERHLNQTPAEALDELLHTIVARFRTPPIEFRPTTELPDESPLLMELDLARAAEQEAMRIRRTMPAPRLRVRSRGGIFDEYAQARPRRNRR